MSDTDKAPPAQAAAPPAAGPRKLARGDLRTEVQFIPKVGPQRARQLDRVGIKTLGDLLYYLPRRYLDRSLIVPINALDLSDREVTVVGKVVNFGLFGGGRVARRFEVTLTDGTGVLLGVWFQGLQYWIGAFQPGEHVAFSGKAQYYRERLQMSHPAVDFLDEQESLGLKAKTGAIISLYPSGEQLTKVGLDSRGIRRIMAEGLNLAKGMIPEFLPPDLMKRHALLSRADALQQVHFPDSMTKKEAGWRRLKYEEMFSVQVTLALRQFKRKHRQQGNAFPRPARGGLTAQAVKKLPFQLTDGQLSVLTDIRKDMEAPHPMNRLLQGDVGSGKTAVAVIALMMAAEGGYQGALMVPTEVLAEQHHRTWEPFFQALGIKSALLIGGLGVAARRQALDQISSGQAQVVIGTHALIQEKVQFSRLGLVIVDEQHRFGVAQRLKLRQKGQTPDVLVLTATPIPRSLALTIYGDLEISLLKERPGHRQPIKTLIRSSRDLEKIIAFLKKEFDKGRQAFMVYPLVEASEKLDLQAAVEAYEEFHVGALQKYRLGLVHGRLLLEEKDRVMRQFSRGELDLLIATSVVEVGIDVPNATVMVVMAAQRFGLSQLHQLRGRIGRGVHPGVCALVADYPMSSDAKDRLTALEKTEDGFVIAEEDLRIRGGGEFFGTRQHGAPDFKIADPIADRMLLEIARQDAFDTVRQDPGLNSYPTLRAHFQQAWGEKMELMDVG
ncbi:MAG: ATP-dependent DNA helicase RecG [bacterium]|nr:ATP-dependent DNA helicase RecG [bacterium]